MSLQRGRALCCALVALASGAGCSHAQGVWATFPGAAYYPPEPDPLEGITQVVVVVAPPRAEAGIDVARSAALAGRWATRLCGLVEGSGRRCGVVASNAGTTSADGGARLELAVTVSPWFEQTSPAVSHVECVRFEERPVYVEGEFQGLRPGACLEAGEERELPERLVEGREGLAVLRLVVAGRAPREQSVRCSPLLGGAEREFSDEPPSALHAGILPELRAAPAEYFLVDSGQPELAAGVDAFSRGDLVGAIAHFELASRSAATAQAAAGRANLGQLRCLRGEGEAAIAQLSVALDGLGCGGSGAPPDGSACERLRALRFSGCRALVFGSRPAPASAP